MIRSFCARLRADIESEVVARRDRLEAGTGGFTQDERVRGEIWGFRKALDIVSELEEIARRADKDDGDDML